MKKSPPPTPKKSSHTASTILSICFNQSSYLTKCNTVGSSFFSFLHPLFYLFFTSFFCCSIYFVSFVSIPNGSVKNKAIALYEQLDDAEAVAELAEAKSQLQQHRLRLKRRCTEAGHDAGEALRWERKMQTAKTRRRPSWTTERWKSEKLAEMDTCLFFNGS